MSDFETNDIDYFTEIYAWVDGFELSRPKKNIARDFSDAGLIAEIIKTYQPKMVNLNNYPVTLNTSQKMVNWELLNKKVLKKLKFKMTKKEMQDISECKPTIVEYFLGRLRDKLEALDRNDFIIEDDDIMEKSVKELDVVKKKLLVTRLVDVIQGTKNIVEAEGGEYQKDLEEVLELKEKIERLEREMGDMYKVLKAKDRRIAVLEEEIIANDVIL